MSTSDFLTLKDGPTLPLDAVRLALDLEARGFHLTTSEGILTVGRLDDVPMSADLLSAADIESIKRWKQHLIAIVTYGARQ